MNSPQQMSIDELAEQLALRASRKCADGYAIPFDSDLDQAAASALSSQSLSLSEAMTENDRKDAEIERLKGLVAGIREAQEPAFDLVSHLERQRAWSAKTFGPGTRTLGVLDHIRKELSEIEADPADVKEWVDVIILAFDGAWRAGWEPTEVVKAMVAKQTKNEARNWPDWRTSSPDKAIEHVRGHND